MLKPIKAWSTQEITDQLHWSEHFYTLTNKIHLLRERLGHYEKYNINVSQSDKELYNTTNY